ncbi:MAG: hypothetical protein AAF806_15450, partial [Bacteroidota bacterium]
MSISRIIFTSDLLRISGKLNLHHTVAKNTHWLYQVLNRPIQFATAKEIEIVEWEADGKFNGIQFFDLLELPVSVESWAKTYFKAEVPDQVLQYFSTHFHDALIIGFEISPFIMNIFTKLGLPCINIMWDPVRFMDDIFFCFSTNNTDIYERLLAYQLPRTLIHQSADLQKARFLRKAPSIDVQGTLFLGQTSIDRSLIEGDQIRQLEEFEADLLNLKMEAEVRFKPHPFDQKKEQRLGLMKKLGIQILEDKYDTYDLLCAESIQKVAAISSGTTVEAHFFGKAAQTFIAPYYLFHQESPNFNEQSCIAVFDEYLSINFWADILSPVFPFTRTLDRNLPFKPNRMRNATCSYWGYREPIQEQVLLK